MLGFYIDFIPDYIAESNLNSPVFTYNCGACRKQVKSSIIMNCLICNNKLCEECYKKGFCRDHYENLSAKGKKEFNLLVRNYQNKIIVLVLFLLFSILFCVIWAPTIIITLNNYNINLNDFIVVFLAVSPIFVVFIPYIINFSKIVDKFHYRNRNDKIDLYYRDKKEGKIK